ncbi:MAG TPA: hypothetical protein V6D17_10955 [Candidatus Obscuribacterales bacterium]
MNQQKKAKHIRLVASNGEAKADPLLYTCSRQLPLATPPKENPQDLARNKKKLADIVGDPNAPENLWLAACTVAGDKSLVVRPSWPAKIGDTITTLITCVLGFFAMVLSFFCLFYIGSHVSTFAFGLDINAFMQMSKDAQFLGVFAGLLAYVSFWNIMLTKTNWWQWFITGSSLFLAGLLGWVAATDTFGVLSLVLAALGILAVATTALSAKLCKEALPKYLHPAKLYRSTFLTLLTPGAICATAAFMAFAHPHGSGRPYHQTSTEGVIISLTMLALGMLLPGLCMARVSKSTSVQGCTFLAFITQLPILLGMFLCTLAYAVQTPSAVSLLICLMLSTILALLLVTGGGALGALSNRWWKR